MAITQQVGTLRAGIDRRRLRRYLTLVGLLGPAMFFMILVFVVSLVFLFSNSVFRFNGLQIEGTLTLAAYVKFFTDPFVARVVGQGLQLAAVTTAVCLLLGYPAAYSMSRLRNQGALVAAFIVVFSPLLTSVIVRSYGWLLLLADTGLVNYLLVSVHLVEQPIRMLFNFFGVSVSLVQVLLPYSIFPILSVLLQLDPALKEASADLGANRLRTFWHIVLPLSLPGVFSAFQLTFVLTMSAFVTPRMLGGGRVLVLPIMIYENISDLNWPLAAVEAMVLLSLVLIVIFSSNLLFRRVYRSLEG